MHEQIAIGVIVAVVLAVLGWMIRLSKFKADERKILNFLQDSAKSTEHQFRSSNAIASSTNLTVSRVASVCSKSSGISRNTAEKESWRLS